MGSGHVCVLDISSISQINSTGISEYPKILMKLKILQPAASLFAVNG